MLAQKNNLDIKEFTEHFFTNLKCETSWQNNILLVENVPPQFESFVGKKSPYKLAFSSEHQGHEVELITRGSYFLTAMSKFLSSRSKKTILKMEVDIDPIAEINERFKLQNSKIENVKVEEKYEPLIRFTFSTTFQYRNGKKQETSQIFVSGGKIIPLDFSKYNFSQVEKKLSRVGNLESEYELAKKDLAAKVAKRTEQIGSSLKPLLERELAKIKDHFIQQLSESEDEINSLEDQITLLEEKMKKAKDPLKFEKRIADLRSTFKEKESSSSQKIESLKKEQDLVMEDEKYKHSLNVTNKLINTSIIFIPHFTFKTKLSTNESQANVHFEYDSLQKFMPKIKSITGKELYDFYICAGGSVCEKQDLAQCFEDNKLYAKQLMKSRCEHSGKLIADKNAKRCDITRKNYAKSYVKKDDVTGKNVYINLLARCPATGSRTTKENLKPCPNCGTKIIPSAIKRKFDNGRVKSYCACCKR